MRKKNFKGRCEKRTISKCDEVCRTFDPIQYAYADILQASEDIKEIRCNVPLDASRLYWLRRGVTDWGLVINEE